MTTPDDEGPGGTRPRITRPEPGRTEPRRGWSNIFGDSLSSMNSPASFLRSLIVFGSFEPLSSSAFETCA